MSATQCVGTTLKGVRCRRKVIGSIYCYHHSKNGNDGKSEDLNLGFTKNPSHPPRGCLRNLSEWKQPERVATFEDIFIFEQLILYMASYVDLLNLCLASKKFAAKMNGDIFNKNVIALIDRLYSVDISLSDYSRIPKYFGCVDTLKQGFVPTPMNLFHLITDNCAVKKDLICSRTGKIIRVVISGMEMYQKKMYSGQLIITPLGTGCFIGFDENTNDIWTYLAAEYQTKSFSDQLASRYRGISDREGALSKNVVFLDDIEDMNDFV